MTENKEMVKVEESKSWEEALAKESWIAPVVDIYETQDDYILRANMPGVGKDNVKIKLEDGNLILMGRVDYNELLGKKYVMRESELGNFYRKFKISDSVDESKLDAKLNNGQLVIQLPKHERVKPRTIEIK